MKNLEHIMLLSDLDGTLLNSKSELSEKNKKAIHEFVERGGKFGIATGRSHLNSKRFTDAVGVNIPCITYNGCGLFDYSKNKFIKIYELPKMDLKNYLKDCLDKYKEVTIQIYSPYMCYIISDETLANKKLISMHQPCEFSNIESIEDQAWIKILFFGKEEDLNAIESGIKNSNLSTEIDTVYSSDSLLELLPLGISKGSMLLSLKENLNKTYKVYAVGDYYNDKEMLLNADIGIATSNALEDIREVADFVTVSNDQNAIADVIYNKIFKEI